MTETFDECEKVFPAHAGMSQTPRPALFVPARFPRSRGDEPPLHMDRDANAEFSPLTRG